MSLNQRWTPEEPRGPRLVAAARRHRPTAFGVALVVAILLIATWRELFSPEAGPHRILIACVRASQVVLDVLFLNGLWFFVTTRVPGAIKSGVVALITNVLVCSLFAWGAHVTLERLGLHDVMPTSSLGAVRDGALASLYLFALWMLGFRYPDLVRTSQMRADETDRLREQAELVQLRAHLQPHFIRNTLNAIAALVNDRPREARRMLATLGDLLTESLDRVGTSHTLEEEVAWLRRYAMILEARHHGALVFEWDVAPAARGVLVPVLLLQPLVENAVLHGALCRDGGGRVEVRASVRASGGIEVVVTDNGPGFDANAQGKATLGLRIVRRRIDLECPGASFCIESTAKGTRVVLEMP